MPTTQPNATHRDAFLGLDNATAPEKDSATPTGDHIGSPLRNVRNYENACNHAPEKDSANQPQQTAPQAEPQQIVMQLPPWLRMGERGNTVDSWSFVSWFKEVYKVTFSGEQFYFGSEKVPQNMIKRYLLDEIEPVAKVSTYQLRAICSLLEDRTTVQAPNISPDAIYFKNCTLLFGEAAPGQGQDLKFDPNFVACNDGARVLEQLYLLNKPQPTHRDAFLGLDNATAPEKDTATPTGDHIGSPLRNVRNDENACNHAPENAPENTCKTARETDKTNPTHRDAFLPLDNENLAPHGETNPTHRDAFLPLDITMHFTFPLPYAPCLLPQVFHPNVGEPVRLLAFLSQLFYPEDIPTVQQFLGYCLMPSTKAQKSLFLIGAGGEGKSRLSVLMQLILGERSVVSSVGQIGERFFGTVLQNRLLFIDDDLQSSKFVATDTFKTLVTNECELMVEPKGKPHYTIRPYARFLLMGNQAVGALHDRSDGFYRRIHIVKVRPRNAARADNPTLIQDIWQAEQGEILYWLVKGALQLVRHNYRLPESARSKAALNSLKEDDNTALAFLHEHSFRYAPQYTVTASELTAKYKRWCDENDLHKIGGQAFKQTCEKFFAKGGGVYSHNIMVHRRTVRGYRGVDFENW